MKRLILHVGPHKTGSSYLQKRLMLSRPVLEQQGVLYPEQFFFVFGHHYLCQALNKKVLSSEDQFSIDSINSFEGDVILSSENFSVQPRRFFERLRDVFDAEEILLSYVYRTPTDRLFSYWNEQVKHGSVEGFYEYTGPIFMRPYIVKDVNYLIFLKMVSDVFGRDSVRIIDYSSIRKNSNACSAFLSSVSLGTLIPDTNENVNSMWLAEDIEIIRQLNAVHIANGKLPKERIRESYKRLASSDDFDYGNLLGALAKYKKMLALGNTHIDKFVYDGINSNFEGVVCGGISKPLNKDKTIVTPGWFSEKSSRDDLLEIYEEISRDLN